MFIVLLIYININAIIVFFDDDDDDEYTVYLQNVAEMPCALHIILTSYHHIMHITSYVCFFWIMFFVGSTP
jgi:hypothetical protein